MADKRADRRQGELFARGQEDAPWEVDAARIRRVARVVFAEMPYGPFDYEVPASLSDEVREGGRVEVPLGRGNRRRLGYCVAIDDRMVGGEKLKAVHRVPEPSVPVPISLMRLAEWMSRYYRCPLGQTLEGMVPAGVRARAGTRRQVVLELAPGVASRLDELRLTPRQRGVLDELSRAGRAMTTAELARVSGGTSGPIQSLRKRGLIASRWTRLRTQPVDEPVATPFARPELNEAQASAVERVVESLRSGRHQTLLLHGVTGSGKTEVYLRAVEEVVQYGRQALVLVPEISLTPQTCQRFRARFPAVAVLHSHLSPPERSWHWDRIERGEVTVVVGARSAVFAPAAHLGLIVLDEEHDASFKQDQAPRYHARDVARERARSASIPLLLGSATPSLEAWHACRQGDAELMELSHRVLDLPMPDVVTIDLRSERRFVGGGAISRPLAQAIRLALREGGQVILLLNRRGFATSIQCPSCGHVVECPECDLALTHHHQAKTAICHYCAYQRPTPARCPGCGSADIRLSGLGTQKLEAEVGSRFREASCLRMDSDTMQRPGSHTEALDRFRAGEIDILLGTQMIAKGLDFPNVTVVGVINADTALHLPDFRAGERTFQLVTQVSGRTGRGPRGGRVYVQTFNPEHPALQAAARHDFLAFAGQELETRRQYGYPPCSSLARLVVRGEHEARAEAWIEVAAQRLRDANRDRELNVRLIGPAPAPFPRLRNRYRFHLLLLADDREQLQTLLDLLEGDWPESDDVQWIIDMDPWELV